jgi:hypothetical protein
MLTKKISLVLLGAFMLGTTSSNAQMWWNKKKKAAPVEQQKPKPKIDKNAPKPYSEVITKEAITDEGLFSVHKIGADRYYEIPDSLLGKEMLMVSRIAKTANGIGFGGGKINTQVLRWEKKENMINLRVVSHDIVADDDLPIKEAVVNSNFEPVLFSFKIEALRNDSIVKSSVIKASDLFSKDVKALGMPDSYRKRYKVTRLDSDKSFIESIKSYPLNIEARHVKTYIASAPPSNSSLGTISVEINNSMILLPENPMKRRYFDKRVGWFKRDQVDYGLEDQKTKTVSFLDRWRLEVKDEDVAKFKKRRTRSA